MHMTKASDNQRKSAVAKPRVAKPRGIDARVGVVETQVTQVATKLESVATKEDLANLKTATREDYFALREEMRAGFVKLREEMDARFSAQGAAILVLQTQMTELQSSVRRGTAGIIATIVASVIVLMMQQILAG
ncbi:MAG: hypothetical protein OD817_02795 [Gammaproteobacteria bacterium]